MEEGTIAIALSADAESAHELLNHGRRIARDLGLPWTALFIEPATDVSSKRLSTLETLVASYGGDLRHIVRDDVVGALLDLARDIHTHLLVIGPSRRPRFLRRLIRGTTERILEAKRPFPVAVAGKGAKR